MVMAGRAVSMVTLLRMSDGDGLPDNQSYMRAVKDRCEAAGVLLLFADEKTFIQALMAAGYLTIKGEEV